jgi:ABC-type dipeptide/oligopeptide/nickel transport system ATPase component
MTRLEAIGGYPPDFSNLPQGCAFSPRCPLRFEKCTEAPGLQSLESGHTAACWRAEEVLNMPDGKMLAKEAIEHPMP